MPVRKKDTARALRLLEDYCANLKKPEEQHLKTGIQRVMGVFKSSLFQALLDIQEFYEVTLQNSQKSCEQKLDEVNHTAEQWEQTGFNTTVQQHSCLSEMRTGSTTEPDVKEQTEISVNVSQNRPAAVQGSPHTGQTPVCMNPALMSTPWQYRYQDDDSPPEHGFPRLTNEVRPPELVHVSEKNLSEIENVHGYVSHSHISPLKVSQRPVPPPPPS
ncbi:hypothetical protein UPYG_G00124130 [Umbra pygmaea]|uniref:L27 domain-containing protein n=1 Tax=Umbra pygmaea TaxID=75934 RepID=A0ABD0X5X4_UMBPY